MSEYLLSVFDYAAVAAERLDKPVYDYYAGGAMDEITLRENHAAYDRLQLNYRVLPGLGEIDTSVELLGCKLSMPVCVAPTAFHKMAHPDGELGTVRAAGKAQTLFILSGLSNTAMEEVFAETSAPKWFQLYIYKDRGVTEALVWRAEAAGAEAIVLTVDAQIWGVREADVRNNFQLPEGLFVENLTAAGKQSFPPGEGSGLAAYVTQMFDASIGWDDLDWLCSITDLPVVVKGICVAEDAVLAAEHGAAAVVVSNHGGRQLDTCPATIEVLPAVAEAAADRLEILVDGGIRRGTDVVKALAAGARAVLVGRPVLWGLAVDGEAGVDAVLALLKKEFADAMALCGCDAVTQIDAEFLRPPAG